MKISKGRALLLTSAIAIPAAVAIQVPAQAITCDSAIIGVYVAVRTSNPTLTNESGSRAVKLELRNERVADWSHARLSGSTRSGDRVWVERSSSSSGPWTQCPMKTISSSNQSITTTEANNIGYYMRACLDYPVLSYRSTICTSSYYDAD